MNEEAFDRHQPFAGDANYLERMHRKEDERHRRATESMRKVFADCMEQEANSPPEAQVEFVIRVASVAPGALALNVVNKWMRQEAVACLLGDEGIAFLINEGAKP